MLDDSAGSVLRDPELLKQLVPGLLLILQFTQAHPVALEMAPSHPALLVLAGAAFGEDI